MIPRKLGVGSENGGPRGKGRVVPVGLDVDVSPRRAVASVNVRRDDKAVFDALHAWWSVERRRPLTQWEAFSVLLAVALENPEFRVPAEVDALMR